MTYKQPFYCAPVALCLQMAARTGRIQGWIKQGRMYWVYVKDWKEG